MVILYLESVGYSVWSSRVGRIRSSGAATPGAEDRDLVLMLYQESVDYREHRSSGAATLGSEERSLVLIRQKLITNRQTSGDPKITNVV